MPIIAQHERFYHTVSSLSRMPYFISVKPRSVYSVLVKDLWEGLAGGKEGTYF